MVSWARFSGSAACSSLDIVSHILAFGKVMSTQLQPHWIAIVEPATVDPVASGAFARSGGRRSRRFGSE